MLGCYLSFMSGKLKGDLVRSLAKVPQQDEPGHSIQTGPLNSVSLGYMDIKLIAPWEKKGILDK